MAAAGTTGLCCQNSCRDQAVKKQTVSCEDDDCVCHQGKTPLRIDASKLHSKTCLSTYEKPCKNCKVQNHTVVEENLLQIQNRLGISPDSQCPCKENQKEPHKVYAWTPPGLPADKIDEYFAQLPNNKVPRWKSPGEQYREKQLVLQLPKQDLALAYCRYLDKMHHKSFEDFVNMRNELALDIAYVREYLDKPKECAKCRGTMLKGDVAVIAPKFGESICWHPACFVCSTCDELLVDLTHCVKDRKLYCERHFAEQIKPRCSACDEYAPELGTVKLVS